ncbi:hypothetical protein AVEN_202270-1 [Araneus ventricosus]|uniref:Mos1 transposase HTH domain-containing protein n=1 Tax=Araneus ventricosus TaxID=182803 RepID=A0A4Y2CQQ3_ARAVE|nr:hypothetical protein AVEN_202270-1 [Araneus ventricosus]
MSRVYSENYTSDGVVREWCRKFKDGRTDVHDEDRRERKFVATEDLAQRVPGSYCGSLNGNVFDHPACNRDLETSDFHLFFALKNRLECQSFQKKEEFQSNVKAHLTSLAATFFEERNRKPGLPIC